MARFNPLLGVDVGGHRSFRPRALVGGLAHLDVLNAGAAEKLVVRRSLSQTALRAELTARLLFEKEIAICQSNETFRTVEDRALLDQLVEQDFVQIVSAPVRRTIASPELPITVPPGPPWLLKVVEADHRFALGHYRHSNRAIGLLGQLDHWFGVAVTTRSASTMSWPAQLLRTWSADRSASSRAVENGSRVRLLI